MPERLCLVSPGSRGRQGERVQIDPKTVEGVLEYAKTWPGEIVLVARADPSARETAIAFDWPRLADLPFPVEVVDDVAGTVRRLAPSVSLVPLELENTWCLDGPGSVVLVSDYP